MSCVRGSEPAWRVILLVGLALVLAACTGRNTKGKITGADAPPGAVPDVIGSYSVNGIDPIGTEYGGNLTIKPGAGAGAYRLQWIVTGSIQEGDGRLEGNTLRVEWRTVQDMVPASGFTTYMVTTQRELYGQRVVVGFPNPGTENAFPNPETTPR